MKGSLEDILVTAAKMCRESDRFGTIEFETASQRIEKSFKNTRLLWVDAGSCTLDLFSSSKENCDKTSL